MITWIDISKVLAGVALFLMGLRLLEESLHKMSGRRFKLFLKKQTSNKLRAIAGGAIVTGVLQSSSLVSLMVLAFVGASVIPMENALAVILGANLGTTLDSWIVASVGFRMNIENLALPLAGVAGIGYSVLNKESKGYNWSRFLVGFSFLFIGLAYMKNGMEDLVRSTDLTRFEGSPLVVFLLIGFIITTLIQSSSATVAITLSALHAGAFTLLPAMALVLGSEIGTTIKLFVAGIKGNAAKKRVVMGNFMFNGSNVLLVLLLIVPLHRFITGSLGIADPIYALVFFQMLVNIIGIILFYPLLNGVARILNRLYSADDNETLFIHHVSPAQTSIASMALEQESRHFLIAVLHYSGSCFQRESGPFPQVTLRKKFTGGNLSEKYAYLKYLHGEIHSFYIRAQKHCTDNEETDQLGRLISSVRNAMYAAKNIKDALPDLEQLQNSSNDIKYGFYLETRDNIDEFLKMAYALLSDPAPAGITTITDLYHAVTAKYTMRVQQLYRESTAGFVDETEITTLLNFNREIFTFYKSLLFGLKDHLFDKEQSRYFDELPGFIR